MEKDYREIVRQQAKALAEALAQSPEFSEFIEAKHRLEADGDNSSILRDLRQQQMSLRMAAIMGEDVDENFHDFENNFRLITQEPSINDYLFAEGRFFRLVADIEEILGRHLGVWIGDDEAEPYTHSHPHNLN